MKLKSKLIATIVSMCAAIAVMGVGVWASTSQNFTVTVNNDIDVKIIGVNADVYGEFALYTQYIGHGQATSATTPNDYAARIGKPQKATLTDRSTYDHGYLLYAQSLGYNDGIKGTSDDKNSYGVKNSFGYGKYINEAKNNVFLATEKATLLNSNAASNPEGVLNLRTTKDEGASQDYSAIYNVDATTHTAQAAYLYTVNQWVETQGNNAIYTTIDVNLSEDLIKRINGTANDKGANAQIRPYLYVGKLTKNENRENDSIEWRLQKMTVTETKTASAKFEIPADKTNDNVYYIMLTFTFGRNSANLDLSLLKDALNHTVTMKAEKESTETFAAWNADANTAVNLYSATGASTTNGSYTVTGTLFKPNTRAFETQVNLEATNEQLKNCFALAGSGDDNLKLSSLPLGYIYVGTSTTDSTPETTSWGWLKELNEGGRTSSFGNGFDATGNTLA